MERIRLGNYAPLVDLQYKRFVLVQPQSTATTGDLYAETCTIFDSPHIWEEKLGVTAYSWDPITNWAHDIHRMSAKSGKYHGSTEVQFGADEYKEYLPAMGDFNVAQHFSRVCLGHLLRRKAHTIVLGHVGWETKKQGSGQSAVTIRVRAGMGLVGGAHIETWGGQFAHYLHLEWKTKLVEEKGEQVEKNILRAQLIPDKTFGAKLTTRNPAHGKWVIVPTSGKDQAEFLKDLFGGSGINLADPRNTQLRLGMYGMEGTGKSRLATSLMGVCPGRMLVLCCDPHAHLLMSSAPEFLEPAEGDEAKLPKGLVA